LRSYYDEAEATFGIPWQYLAAIHFVETRMGRIHGLSTAGAQGPMQFIPDTWAAYGEGDINSNHDAIQAAGRYLEANNAATDIDGALFRYNNDERYVAAIKAYASVMMADPGAYDGYYHWQVFYASADGTFLLPEGWSAV
jgi:membrane-bound lytic murein transglycosylase MltF